MVWLLKFGAVAVCSKSWDKLGASSWRGNYHIYLNLEMRGERKSPFFKYKNNMDMVPSWMKKNDMDFGDRPRDFKDTSVNEVGETILLKFPQIEESLTQGFSM